MHRLFVAISLPRSIVDALAGVQSGVRGARWVPEDNFHLTLAFIGDADRHGLNEIALALGGVSASGFDVRLSGCGFFGDRKPRALWAGAETNPALSHLQSKVAVALKRAGFAEEKRRFTPHVTLAYLNGAPREAVASYCAANGLFSAGPFPVSEFHLYESHLGSEAAHYEILQSYPLGAADEAQALHA